MYTKIYAAKGKNGGKKRWVQWVGDFDLQQPERIREGYTEDRLCTFHFMGWLVYV